MENHFHQFLPIITQTLVTKHFHRDKPEFDISLITEGSLENSTHLHKFEEVIDGNHIFRALIHGKHLVYAIDKQHRLIFLRAFHNFKDYKKFLDDKHAIVHMIEHATE